MSYPTIPERQRDIAVAALRKIANRGAGPIAHRLECKEALDQITALDAPPQPDSDADFGWVPSWLSDPPPPTPAAVRGARTNPATSTSAPPQPDLAAGWRRDVSATEPSVFVWLCQRWVQRADDRQKAMGLQYMEAETHDLAKCIATRFCDVEIEAAVAAELARCAGIARRRSNYSGLHQVHDVAYQIAEAIERGEEPT